MNSSNSSKRHVAAEEQLLLHEMHHKNNVSVVPSKQNSTTYGKCYVYIFVLIIEKFSTIFFSDL